MMNLYQVLLCLADETARQEQVEEARAAVRKFFDDHAEDLATDPDQPVTDTYPLVISLFAEEGMCMMPFCHAADLREALTQAGFGDLARKLPNAKIVRQVTDTVREKGGKLPPAFDAWRTQMISEAAKDLAQGAVDAWPETRRVRVTVKARVGRDQPERRDDPDERERSDSDA